MEEWVDSDYFSPPPRAETEGAEAESSLVPGEVTAGTVVGQNKRGIDCMIEFDTGLRRILAPYPYYALEPGQRVLVYSTVTGYSLCNPRWCAYPNQAIREHFGLSELEIATHDKSGRGFLYRDELELLIDSQAGERSEELLAAIEEKVLTFGTSVFFRPTGYDDTDSRLLIGEVYGIRAQLDRRELPWPKFETSYDIEDFGKSIEVVMQDPRILPFPLTGRMRSSPLKGPLPLAIEELDRRGEAILGHLRESSDEGAMPRVSLAGTRVWAVMPWRAFHWQREGGELPKGTFRIRVEVDFARCDLMASRKALEEGPWARIKERYPVGGGPVQCTFLSPRFGGLFEIRDADWYVEGWLERGSVGHEGGEGSPFDFVFGDRESLLVTAHDEHLKRLELCAESGSPPGLAEGAIFPVKYYSTRDGRVEARFSPCSGGLLEASLAEGINSSNGVSWSVVRNGGDGSKMTMQILDPIQQVTFLERSENDAARFQFRGTEIEARWESFMESFEPGTAYRLCLGNVRFLPSRVVVEFSEFCHRVGERIEARVLAVVKGGLTLVDADEGELFLPASQIATRALSEVEQRELIGRTFLVEVVKVTARRNNVVVSRRNILEAEAAQRGRQFLNAAKVGDRVTGKVKALEDFGAFIDLGAIDGLLHITDISWGRVNHPGEVLSLGEEVEVLITGIDHEKERVSLGIKELTENPWEHVAEKYPVGSRVRGVVGKLVAYGAFVLLEPDVEGLLHVSELSWTRRITNPGDVLESGQEIEVVVLGVEVEEKKISLGVRQLEPNPWDSATERYRAGSRIVGPVRNLTAYGAFVGLDDGIDGMIHVSDLSWTRKINHPSEVLKKGEEVEALILSVDREKERVVLGVKQLEPDPWAVIDTRYKLGEIVSGTVSKIASFGAFVALDGEIDGMVHISQLSEEHVERVKDVLAIGDVVEARIVKVDKVERRIGLSIKGLAWSGEQLVEKLAEIQEERSAAEEGWEPGGGNLEESEPGAAGGAAAQGPGGEDPSVDSAGSGEGRGESGEEDERGGARRERDPGILPSATTRGKAGDEAVGGVGEADCAPGAETGSERGLPVVTARPPIIIASLAERMGLEPFELINDLLALGVVVSPNDAIEPGIAAKVCEARGFRFKLPEDALVGQVSEGSAGLPEDSRDATGTRAEEGSRAPAVGAIKIGDFDFSKMLGIRLPAERTAADPLSPERAGSDSGSGTLEPGGGSGESHEAEASEDSSRRPIESDAAFSRANVLTSYPAPIALAYKRFLRLDLDMQAGEASVALNNALEAVLKYLFYLGISDVFRIMALGSEAEFKCLDHPDLAFLKGSGAPQTTGRWAGALREVARDLQRAREKTIPEIGQKLGPGSEADLQIRKLTEPRRRWAHSPANIGLNRDEHRELVASYRPHLDRLLELISFVSLYPLGFFVPEAAGPEEDEEERMGELYNCMGANDTGFQVKALRLKMGIREKEPFVMSVESGDVLYLWPMVGQRESDISTYRHLFVFEKLRRGQRFLSGVEAEAIDMRESWSRKILQETPQDYSPILERLRQWYDELSRKPGPWGGNLFSTPRRDLEQRQLGAHRLGRILGTGALSTVYLASRGSAQEKVALKVLSRDALPADVNRFVEEHKRLSVLPKEHFIKVFDAGSDIVNDYRRYWYAMEVAEGGDLRSLIHPLDESKTDERETTRFFVQKFLHLLEGVDHLHSQNWVHRDLKPGNILISDGGAWKIGDLGLLKNLDPSEETRRDHPKTTTGARLGTDRYMSPEQAAGQHRELDPASDVYSLGILLAELLVGKLLEGCRPEPNQSSLVHTLEVGRLERGLRRVLLKATMWRSSDRYRDAGDFEAYLRTWHDDYFAEDRDRT